MHTSGGRQPYSSHAAPSACTAGAARPGVDAEDERVGVARRVAVLAHELGQLADALAHLAPQLARHYAHLPRAPHTSV